MFSNLADKFNNENNTQIIHILYHCLPKSEESIVKIINQVTKKNSEENSTIYVNM
jgi:hypothetical protein